MAVRAAWVIFLTSDSQVGTSALPRATDQQPLDLGLRAATSRFTGSGQDRADGAMPPIICSGRQAADGK